MTLSKSKLPKVGISACVLGQNVRYDGRNKENEICTKLLQTIYLMRPVCPEMSIGMKTPREPIQRVFRKDRITLEAVSKQFDATEEMRQFAVEQAILSHQLDGYIFCPKSPSCGIESVKIFDPKGNVIEENTAGIFTEQIIKRNPLLPIIESQMLFDRAKRESFMTRVSILHHWKNFREPITDMNQLRYFHESIHYQLIGYSTNIDSSILTKLDSPYADIKKIIDIYLTELMKVMAQPIAHDGHVKILMQIIDQSESLTIKADYEALIQIVRRYVTHQSSLVDTLRQVKETLQPYPDHPANQQTYFCLSTEEMRLRYDK